MGFINEFISIHGSAILYAVVTSIVGYIGITIKNLYTKTINDKTAKDVVKTCVQAVEQIYTDLHGEDKLNKCIEAASSMLCAKGISITEFEIRMLIEASVSEFNRSFEEIGIVEGILIEGETDVAAEQ